MGIKFQENQFSYHMKQFQNLFEMKLDAVHKTVGHLYLFVNSAIDNIPI